MSSETIRKLEIKSDLGTINAMEHWPSIAPKGWIIGSHGMLSSYNSEKLVELGGRLADEGFIFLRVNYTGQGEDPRELLCPLSMRMEMLLSSVNHMCDKYPGLPWGLFGSSLGGLQSLLMADKRKDISATVTWSAPKGMEKFKKNIYIIGSELFPGIPSEVVMKIADSFQNDALKFRLGQPGNVLIIHGGQDELVPLDHAKKILTKSVDPKELFFIPEGDHSFANVPAREKALKRTLEWFIEHIK